MKTFERHRSIAEIRKLLHGRKGWKLDTTAYDRSGHDHVSLTFVVGNTKGWVLYNTFNGKFFGDYGKVGSPRRDNFSSSDASLDRKRWFQALLNLFYVPESK